MSDEVRTPALGTPEAAVRSCVALISAVTGQREEYMAYWLDLYFQVRCVYERTQAEEPDPNVITRADLYLVLKELWRDAMRSTARDDATARAAGKSRAMAPLEMTGTEENGAADAAPPPRDSGLSEFEPVAPKREGAWTIRKKTIMRRLSQARLQGLTIGKIAAAEPGLTENVILDVMNAGKVSAGDWTHIENALDALGVAK